MTILLVLTSLILISIAVWQLTKILELSKPVDFENNEIATDNDNDMPVSYTHLTLPTNRCV